MAKINMLGSVFGRLTVVAEAAERHHRKVRWECLCVCGNKTTVLGTSLRCGETASCGCLFQEIKGKQPITHGYSRTRTYHIWGGMRARATNPRAAAAHNYVERGIGCCDRWASFENFLADMGEAPEGLLLERRDNDGNYEPGNCYWATREQQNNNRRPCAHYTVDGVTLTPAQWARVWQITRYFAIKKLREMGISPETNHSPKETHHAEKPPQ